MSPVHAFYGLRSRVPRWCLGLWLVMLLCLSASGCVSDALRWEHEAYTVRRGDTLYSIAWHFGVDHRQLAQWNRLGDGDVIYPGQRLRLKPPAGRATARAAKPASPKAAAAGSQAEPRGDPRQRPAPHWRWPVDGPVLAAFGDSASVGKGIDIGGKAGQPVVAAASGRVVYAGSGLVGYGQLIIIKHNETYLSAYAHNAALLVKQGDSIAAGQRIAEMGLGPRKRPMLHFEIRVDGEAIDPLRFLPRR